MPSHRKYFNDHPGQKCHATTSSGQPCKKWAIHGGAVCRSHGGASPRVKAAAMVRAEVMAWGLGDTHISPSEVMLRLVSQSTIRVERISSELDRLVAELSLRDALVGDTIVVDGDGGEHKSGEYHRVLSVIEDAERDRLMRFCKIAVDAGLMERQVKLDEIQGALIAEVLRTVLNDPALGLSEEQRKAVPDVARRVLSIVN